MSANPIAAAPDKWHSGSAYERYMGRWSRQLAPRFLQWLDAPPGRHWLDVGCGTGALCAAILQACAPQSVTGVDPSEGFLSTARSHLPAQVVLLRTAAGDLLLPDASVDMTVSSLVLNFVPDVPTALREMVRVTARGGCVAACVWDYAGKMELMRRYWDAAAQLGLLAPGQDQGERFAICHPDPLAQAFAEAGLQQVGISAIDMTMRFADFDDYWQPFLGGQGPAPAHAMSLDEATRARLRDAIRERVPGGGGAIVLAARAWAARGTVER
jgi:SAM-dependent methyltransferase